MTAAPSTSRTATARARASSPAGPWDPAPSTPGRRRPCSARASSAASRATGCGSGASRSRSSGPCRSRRSPPRRAWCARAAASSCSRPRSPGPDGEVMRASAWRLRPSGDAAARRRDRPPPPGPDAGPRRATSSPPAQEVGYHTAMELQLRARRLPGARPGAWSGCACAGRWSRASSRRRWSALLVAADVGNGVSAVLDWRELPVHQHRPDRPPAAAARGRVGRRRRRDLPELDGVGLAETRALGRARAARPRRPDAGGARALSGLTCPAPCRAEARPMAETPGPVLITGCSTGIGRATAELLARDGHTVYATARRLESIEDLARGRLPHAGARRDRRGRRCAPPWRRWRRPRARSARS